QDQAATNRTHYSVSGTDRVKSNKRCLQATPASHAEPLYMQKHGFDATPCPRTPPPGEYNVILGTACMFNGLRILFIESCSAFYFARNLVPGKSAAAALRGGKTVYKPKTQVLLEPAQSLQDFLVLFNLLFHKFKRLLRPHANNLETIGVHLLYNARVFHDAVDGINQIIHSIIRRSRRHRYAAISPHDDVIAKFLESRHVGEHIHAVGIGNGQCTEFVLVT